MERQKINSERFRLFKYRGSLVLMVVLVLAGHLGWSPLAARQHQAAQAQQPLRQRLQERLHCRQKETLPANAQADAFDADGCRHLQIGGLQVAVWAPLAGQHLPLVIFSHGLHGSNTQSSFIMKALRDAGYLVIAPNHRDALSGSHKFAPPQAPLQAPACWTEHTYEDRKNDIGGLLYALHQDPHWNSVIDWSKVALSGHSLGGYTVLALAGAWPGWRIPGIKAVLALSPYCQPFLSHQTLAELSAPVMYQGGTRDLGITPAIRKPAGAFSQSRSPAYFVEFNKVGHFSWTNLNADLSQQKLIDYYCVSFMDKYVKGSRSAEPAARLPGVVDLQVK